MEIEVAKPGWKICARIWWTLLWRWLAWGIPAGFFVALIFGLLARLMRLEAGPVAVVVWFLATMAMGIVVLRKVLGRPFKTFRLSIFQEKEKENIFVE